MKRLAGLPLALILLLMLTPDPAAAVEPFSVRCEGGVPVRAYSATFDVDAKAVVFETPQGNNSTRTASDLAFIPDINAARANPSSTHGVQMKRDSVAPLQYFLDKAPSDIRASTVPTTAKAVVLARVTLLGTAAGLGGRIPPGGRGNDPLRERLAVSLRVLEVLSGNASVDSVLEATFGVTDQTHSLIPVPRTKSELERDYFVVVYADDGGHWHLAGFPMSEAEYRKWEEKFWADERERMGINPKL